VGARTLNFSEYILCYHDGSLNDLGQIYSIPHCMNKMSTTYNSLKQLFCTCSTSFDNFWSNWDAKQGMHIQEQSEL